MYRYTCASDGNAWMLITPSVVSEAMVHTRNITDGGKPGPAFSLGTWGYLVLTGRMVRQSWFDQLDL